MSISLTYMNELRDYLEAQYASDPPILAQIGTIKVGTFQDDPTPSPAVITIHPHNPLDGDYRDPHMEIIEKNRGVGITQSQLQGAYMEIGGGYHMYLYWWLSARYFLTRTGEDQATAQEYWDDLMLWLTRKINNAQPSTLGLSTVDGQTLIETILLSLTPRESGGRPNQYIWTTFFKIRGLAHGERFS